MFEIFNLSLILGICKDFGPIAGWVIIVWLLWKIASNHLRHLKTDNVEIKGMITTLGKKVEASTEKLNTKIEAVDAKVNSLGERTAKLEGQVQ